MVACSERSKPFARLLRATSNPSAKEDSSQEIKRTFEDALKKNVNLARASSLVLATKRPDFNDSLNGTEHPATFCPRAFPGIKVT